jgi:cell division protein FtsI (penicillin-binding protein 3)
VVFVLIDEPAMGSQLGGAVAAPTVGRVVDRIAAFLGVARVVDPLPVPMAAPR